MFLASHGGKFFSELYPIRSLRDARRRQRSFRKNSADFGGNDRHQHHLRILVHRLQELGKASNVSLNICIINPQEGNDSVDRKLLWELLARFGVPARMSKVICMFHDGMRAWMFHEEEGLLS